MSNPEWEVAEALEPLLHPSRYKAAYGGRGGMKSHFFAGLSIVRARASKTRIACIREVQDTIRDSVRQLLIDKIQALGFGDFFEVLDREIRGTNGSLIIFKGMQNYNAENIKSLEDFDIAWAEEAQTLSEKSLRLLRPTLRKNGSELWFSWNSRYETDAVDKFFRGKTPPEDAIIVKVGIEDNPWASDVLKAECAADYLADPEMARHVWGGDYEIISSGAYYAKWIAAADKEGRIGDFPHDKRLSVETAWDIGVDDYTACWFIQFDGTWHTVVDYYECSGMGPEEIRENALPELVDDPLDRLKQLKAIGRPSPFRYGAHWFPHDVANREWGAGAKSRIQTLVGLNFRDVRKGVQQGPEERINATRAILPRFRFNRTENVMLGVNRLRRYSRKFNEQMQQWMGPLHNEHSHGADAFGEYAINKSERVPARAPEKAKVPMGKVLLPGAPKPSQSTRIDT